MLQKLMKTQPEWPFSLYLFFIISTPSHCSNDQKWGLYENSWLLLNTSLALLLRDILTVKPGKLIDFLKFSLVSKCLEIYRVPSVTVSCVSLKNLSFQWLLCMHIEALFFSALQYFHLHHFKFPFLSVPTRTHCCYDSYPHRMSRLLWLQAVTGERLLLLCKNFCELYWEEMQRDLREK